MRPGSPISAVTTSLPSDGQVAASTVPLEFKGTTLSVTAIVVGDADPSKLQQLLMRKLAEAPGFFEGELALLDFSRLPQQSAGSIDLASLVKPLRQAGMIPVAVRGLAPSLAQLAEAMGLAVLATAPMRRARTDAGPEAADARLAPAAAAPTGHRIGPVAAPAGPAPARPVAATAAATASARAAAAPVASAPRAAATATPASSAPAAAAPAASASAASASAASRAMSATADRRDAGSGAAGGGAIYDTITALVVERPLRSGQRVYARGRDLVLLAGISPGAEVIADGNIHCYGPLRGRALAGASGDATARIFATDFQAELVSIAGVYRTFELTDEQIRGGQPVRISLRNDVTSQAIAIEPISGD